MLTVPVYSGVLKLKNVNKKGLCWQATIARHRFAHGKALSCCFCRYICLVGVAELKPIFYRELKLEDVNVNENVTKQYDLTTENNHFT